MRSDLQRLKRDTETGRTPAASSGGVPAIQEGGTQASTGQATPASASANVGLAGSSSAVKAAEVQVVKKRILWKIAVPSVVVLVALIAVGLYYRSHRAKPLTDKDTVVIADFSNTTGDPVFDGTLKTALKRFSEPVAVSECALREQSSGYVEAYDAPA